MSPRPHPVRRTTSSDSALAQSRHVTWRPAPKRRPFVFAPKPRSIFSFFLPSCRVHTFVCFDVLRTMLFIAHVFDATYHIVFAIIIVFCPTCIHPTHLSCSACSSCTAHSLTKTTPAACVTVHHTATTGRNGAPHDY